MLVVNEGKGIHERVVVVLVAHGEADVLTAIDGAFAGEVFDEDVVSLGHMWTIYPPLDYLGAGGARISNCQLAFASLAGCEPR